MRESEVAAYLKADATLIALLPGKVFAKSDLPESGITSEAGAASVWAGGVFNACAIVRERQPVPDYRVQDEAAKLVSQAQSVEVWLYAADATVVESAADRVYALMQGHKFTSAYAASWFGSLPTTRAPELPNVFMARRDYQIVSLKVAA